MQHVVAACMPHKKESLFTNQFADNSPDKEESANSDIINGRDSLV
jgi:hypothetical protein